MDYYFAKRSSLYTTAIRQNIDYLIEDLLELVSGTTQHADFMFHDLGRLNDSCSFVGLEEIMELCKLLGGVLIRIQIAGRSYLEKIDRILLETCYYLLDYQRCISRQASLPPIPNDLYQKLLKNTERCVDLPVSDADVVYRSHGVKAIVTSKIMKIQFSDITSGLRCLKIIESLRRIFNATPPDMNWLMDLSDFRELPQVIFQTLLDYQEKLQLRGRHIELIGVDNSFLPPEMTKALCERFVIRKKETTNNVQSYDGCSAEEQIENLNQKNND